MKSAEKKSRKKDKITAENSTDVGKPALSNKQIKVIDDPRFASIHSDPRFQNVPKRESKVTIDSRFEKVLNDKRFASSSAPLDKRGKRKKGDSARDSLRQYYRIEEEDKRDNTKRRGEEEESEESESEKESEASKLRVVGSKDDDESEEEDERSESESTTDEEEDDEDEDIEFEEGRPEIVEEDIPSIEKETHRLAVLNMDWRHVSATDLYVVLSSFLPKEGQILSVSVYPSEFGLQRMKEEEVRGPVGLFDDESAKQDEDDDTSDDDVDEEALNRKLRAYEISRLRYYFAVVECDSSATADYLYNTCDGVEFERSSNKLDLRFIPDSMELKHQPRDVAKEAPGNYEGLDFHSQALQMSKVNLMWDEDEPHRAKTLNRQFKADQLAELELKEFLASDESESDSDNDDANVDQINKKEKKKDLYRALIQSGEHSDEDDEEGGQDMEVTFNTGLEDLSKRILEKKDKKSETLWEAHLRKKSEKRKSRKNKSKNLSDDESSDSDEEAIEEPNDFFVEEPSVKRSKKKAKVETDKEVSKEAEASVAELELLLADDKGEDTGLKGYNIKRKKAKGKKGVDVVDDEKIPAANYDDPRFSAILNSPQFALDPTDPQFKRSAAYARQEFQKKRKSEQKEDEIVPAKDPLHSDKAEESEDEGIKSELSQSKKEKLELSSLVRSIKMKSKQVEFLSNKKTKEKHSRATKRRESNGRSQSVKKSKPPAK